VFKFSATSLRIAEVPGLGTAEKHSGCLTEKLEWEVTPHYSREYDVENEHLILGEG
jgi:hypothetical protein